MASREHVAPVVVLAIAFVAGWLWLGTKLEAPVRIWFWCGGALLLALGAYGEHKLNLRKAAEPGYLLQHDSGVVVQAVSPTGQVSVGSELWSARTRGEHLEIGTPVRICGREGLVLLVEAQK